MHLTLIYEVGIVRNQYQQLPLTVAGDGSTSRSVTADVSVMAACCSCKEDHHHHYHHHHHHHHFV